jgi:predicted aspartyl protease
MVLLLCSTQVGATADEPVQVPTSTTTESLVEEVIVEAPEPRYAAPTLRDRIGRIWAPVMINGQGPFRLVLDTGASNSAVISRVADILGIPLHGSANIRVHGVTGSAIVSSIAVDRLEVGDLLIDGTVLPVVADVFGGAEGVLGTEGLSDKRIFIDFKRDQIEIAHSRGERPGLGFSRIPVKLARGRLLTMDVRIGSIRTRAIIDTGAQQTIGNLALRNALTRRARNSKIQDVIGVTLDVAVGDSILAPPIYLGDVMIRGLYVTFSDMFIFEHWKLTREPTLLLGMDVLGLVDTLVIDYKLRELHIRPRS